MLSRAIGELGSERFHEKRLDFRAFAATHGELVARREREPDFRRHLGAEDLGGAGDEPDAERRLVADLDPQLALLLQLHLLYRRRGARRRGRASVRHVGRGGRLRRLLKPKRTGNAGEGEELAAGRGGGGNDESLPVLLWSY